MRVEVGRCVGGWGEGGGGYFGGSNNIPQNIPLLPAAKCYFSAMPKHANPLVTGHNSPTTRPPHCPPSSLPPHTYPPGSCH